MPRKFQDKYSPNNDWIITLYNRMQDLKHEMKVQLPCRVKSVNHEQNCVDIQVLDYDFDNQGNAVNYPILPQVPIRQPMTSGKAFIRLPVQVGDEGTVEFFDSSVDDLLTQSVYQYDESEEWHSLDYGLFTNGFLPNNKLFEFDYNAKLVIGSNNNKFVFKINANDELEVIAEKIDIQCPNIEITGDVNVNGDVIANNISLTSHTHGYSWSDSAGSGNTEQPS